MFPRAGTFDQKYFPGGGTTFSASQPANSNSPLWLGLGGGGGGIYFDWCITPDDFTPQWRTSRSQWVKVNDFTPLKENCT